MTGERLSTGFRGLLAGSVISNLGDGLRLAALPLLAASLTSSEVLISAVTSAQYFAWLAFGLVGGVLVDRWDRRRTILITQTWRGVLIALLTVLVWSSNAEIWHLCVVAFLITAGEILVDPSTVALIPTLVEEQDLDRANGQISSAEIATNDFAGAPIGASLFSVAPWLPLLIDSISYLGSLAGFSRLPKTSPQPSSREPSTMLTDARAAIRWLYRHPVLRPLTVAWMVYFVGAAATMSLLVVMVRTELEASATAFGIVLAVGAIGAFLGTLFGPRFSARRGPQFTLTSMGVLQALATAAAAVAPSLIALAALWFAGGLGAGVQRPVSRSVQQRLTPNTMLGRVNTTSRVFTRGVIAVAALGAGTVAALTDVRVAFAVAGLAQLIAAVMMWRAFRGEAQTLER